jgi:hypothetical protein
MSSESPPSHFEPVLFLGLATNFRSEVLGSTFGVRSLDLGVVLGHN